MKRKWMALLLAITLALPLLPAQAEDVAAFLTIPEGETLTIAEAGVYRLSGSAQEGRILITAPKKSELTLILDGVSLACAAEAVLACENPVDLTIELAPGTENRLTSGAPVSVQETVRAEDADGGAVQVKGDLTIEGEGALFVGGYLNNGVQVSGSLKVKGGVLTVEAIHTGLRGKEGVKLKGGAVTLTTGGDGIAASDEEKGAVAITGGMLTVHSMGDAVQAQTALSVEGGELSLTTGSGSESVQRTGERWGDWDDRGRGGMGGFGRGNRGGDPMNGRGGWGQPGSSDTQPEDGAAVPDNMPPPDGMTPPEEIGFPGSMSPSDAAVNGASDEASADTSISRKGLKSAGTLTVTGGSVSIDTEDDALHAAQVSISGGVMTLSAGDDGVHADKELTIAGGSVTVARSYEGLEALRIEMTGGMVSVTATDDGLNASDGSGDSFGFRGWSPTQNAVSGEQALLHVTGGSLYVNAEGDGLDSNGSLLIEGGLVIVDGPTVSGNGALDAGTESGGTCLVHGGTVLAIGAAGMAESFGSASQQSYISTALTIPAGAEVVITSADGTELLRHTAAKNAQHLVFSCTGLSDGDALTISVNGQSVQVTANRTDSGNGFGFGGGHGRR